MCPNAEMRSGSVCIRRRGMNRRGGGGGWQWGDIVYRGATPGVHRRPPRTPWERHGPPAECGGYARPRGRQPADGALAQPASEPSEALRGPGRVPLAPRARCLSPGAQRPAPRKDAGRALSPRDISPGLGLQEVYNAERPALDVKEIFGTCKVTQSVSPCSVCSSVPGH
jgi:hypothetical protein